MFVCSMLQSSYLLLAPHPGQFTVSFYYNQLARISISLNTFSMQKHGDDFAKGPPGTHTNLLMDNFLYSLAWEILL